MLGTNGTNETKHGTLTQNSVLEPQSWTSPLERCIYMFVSIACIFLTGSYCIVCDLFASHSSHKVQIAVRRDCNCAAKMRSLPPPRNSRKRTIKRLIHQLYKILTLRFLFRKERTIFVKKHHSPFHFTSRRYKVRIPTGKRVHWWSHKPVDDIVVNAKILGDLSRELDGLEVGAGHKRHIFLKARSRKHSLRRILQRIHHLISMSNKHLRYRKSRHLKNVNVVLG